MTRKSGMCSLALAAALWAQIASAQTAGTGGSSGTSSGSGTVSSGGNIRIELKRIGDVEYPVNARPNLTIPIGKAGCNAGKINVTISGLLGGGSFPYIEAWLATGNGNCNQGDRGTRVTSTTNCTQLNIADPNQVQVANRSFYDVDIELGPTCENEGLRPIYILQVASQNSTAAATSYGVMAQLKVDKTAPGAPTGVSGGSGQTVIPLTWAANTVDATDYFVLADKTVGADFDAGALGPDGGVNTQCPSSLLRAGIEFDPSSVPSGLFSKNLTGVGTHEFDFNGALFPGKTVVPAAVVARDLAGNTSKISEVVCLTVTPTTGFWKRYQDDGGDVQPGCACSAPGARSARTGALAGLPLALVLGWAFVRSRTRRRAR